MRFVNVGVAPPHNASKKAMKEAIVADPDTVKFYITSLYDQDLPISFTAKWFADNFKVVSLQVVGPDPSRSRKWYANVEALGEGMLRVR